MVMCGVAGKRSCAMRLRLLIGGTIGSSQPSAILLLHVIRRGFRWFCLWNVVLIPGLSLSERLWSELHCRGAWMETVKTESVGCHCAHKIGWRLN